MEEPPVLSVTNLSKYQHYKHRSPPWIKLYREFWTDHRILQLSPESRLLFLGCCTLASELQNKIPHDLKYLSHRLGFAVTAKSLDPLLYSTLLYSTLREHPGSDALASCKQDASKKGTGKSVFPEGWKPETEFLESWRAFGIDPHIEFARFKDHALSTDRRCKDWLAACRNWFRKAVDMQNASNMLATC